MKKPFKTEAEITWCPGCPNFMILESVRKTLMNLSEQGVQQKDFAMATGIGCHGKMFDYLDISGIYGLHGRVIPTMLGIKLGNPNLTVLGFAGDGDTYAEGMGHFVHAGRYNANITLIVHDNQAFALTTGQATPTSQKGYKNKAMPFGKPTLALNPIKLALTSRASFVARCNARDIAHTSEILEKAIKHNGFSFVEILQDCISFNLETNNRDKQMYKFSQPCKDQEQALKLADEWDYDDGKGKIALGIFWQDTTRTPLEEELPQLKELLKKKVGWTGFKR
ncbi:MAG: 2-oxoacid:ferredoxin oxidoreductase subunit beta [Nanoarchaeota archaeon]|nr:2-oxoacid:ferredoxin oxidoreductase subunit beta [Nanoarchaeota archaeon]MBU1103552.1 2-oxoacid:ferredoxin oxidoreductase subunit beta [Nanoarchaeota archaeon]